MSEVGKRRHRCGAVCEEVGEHIPMRRCEAFESRRRQLVGEPFLLRLVDSRYEFSYVVHDGA